MDVGRVNPLLGVVSGLASAEVIAAIRAREDVSDLADDACLWDAAVFK